MVTGHTNVNLLCLLCRVEIARLTEIIIKMALGIMMDDFYRIITMTFYFPVDFDLFMSMIIEIIQFNLPIKYIHLS